MDVLRTPDERFEGLPGFPFAPHYVDVDDGDGGRLRVHHLDEGPAEAAAVLLMHGEPSWSYLYRTMIPVLVGAGLRCVAPDLVGFGRSDKPAARPTTPTPATSSGCARRSSTTPAAWGRDVTLVCQDWGSLIGLRLVGEHPDRFARVVVANAGLPTGDGRLSKAFQAWQRFSQEAPTFPVGGIVDGGTIADLTPEVIAAYDAPFPSEEYLGGRPRAALAGADRARRPRRARQQGGVGGAGPLRAAAAHRVLRRRPHHRGRRAHLPPHGPGGAGPRHMTIPGGGHFLQEDRGPELAAVVADLVAST